jgi:type VI secretion system protein ImpF
VPELTPQELLQPALLDRLTDNEPDKPVEVRDQRIVSKARLRDAVLRDLQWLFNTTHLEASLSMAHVPFARRSVLNFGLPAFSGRAASSLDVGELERAIGRAILDFEPRILPNTLTIKALLRPDAIDHHNVIGIEIHGLLWAQPAPLQLSVLTEIDLETGKARVAGLPGVRAI